MVTTVIKTVKPSGGDYVSLSAAIAGEARDLVTLNEICVIECYSMTDTIGVVVSGFTTDATHYVEIRTPLSERHNGKWDATKYNLTVVDANALVLSDSHVRVFGLQIAVSSTLYGRSGIVASFPPVGSEYQIAYNIIDGQKNILSASGIASATSGNEVLKIWNNTIYDFNKGWNGGIEISNCAVGSYAYNNTTYGCQYGFKSSAANLLAKNHLSAGNNRAAYNGTPNPSDDYNASDDTTTTGGANDRISQTFTFVDVVNRDLHLASTDAGARGFGVDLSTTFTDDIDGQLRTVPWDIGADEDVSTGGGSALLKIIAETAQVSDGYIRRMVMTRPVSETESLPEDVQRRGVLRRILSEAVNVAEGLIRRGALNRLIGESESVSEGTARRGTLRRIITETQNLTETVVKSISTLLVKVVNESVQMAGAIARRLGLTRTASEGVSISEGTARRGALRRILSETASIAEGIIRSRSLVRIATETITLVDSAVKRAGLVRVVSDVLNIAEDILKNLGFIKVVSEGLNIVEGIFKKLGLDTLGVLGENLTLIFTSVRRGIKSITTKRGIVSKTPKREVKP